MKHKLFIVGLLLLATVGLSSCFLVSWMFPRHTSILKMGQDDIDLYINPVFSYSLPVPHGWSLSENMTPAPSYVLFQAPVVEDQAWIVISTFDDFMDIEKRIAFLKQQPAKLESISAVEFTVEGISAFRLGYMWSGEILYGISSFSTKNKKYKTVSVYILREKSPVTVICMSDAEYFPYYYKKYFQHTLNGIKLSVQKER